MNNLIRLHQSGKRVYAKIIVKPQEQINQFIWEKLWNLGIPAHFVPLEYDHYFNEHIIDRIRANFLTSCMYIARFFRPPQFNIRPVLCKAGTKEMFEVSSGGIVQRCSNVGNIANNILYSQPQLCAKNDCFCEWHHFASMARAEENFRWTEWINTGRWIMPEQREFEKFISAMRYDPGGRTKRVLSEYQKKLQISAWKSEHQPSG
jgi:hypothetical protein